MGGAELGRPTADWELRKCEFPVVLPPGACDPVFRPLDVECGPSSSKILPISCASWKPGPLILETKSRFVLFSYLASFRLQWNQTEPKVAMPSPPSTATLNKEGEQQEWTSHSSGDYCFCLEAFHLITPHIPLNIFQDMSFLPFCSTRLSWKYCHHQRSR